MFGVEEGKDTKCPNNSKDGRKFHEMLFGQMVSGIQLEDEDVIHTGRPEEEHFK